MTDNNHPRFANLRNGGNLPRAAHHQPNRS